MGKEQPIFIHVHKQPAVILHLGETVREYRNHLHRRGAARPESSARRARRRVMAKKKESTRAESTRVSQLEGAGRRRRSRGDAREAKEDRDWETGAVSKGRLTG